MDEDYGHVNSLKCGLIYLKAKWRKEEVANAPTGRNLITAVTIITVRSWNGALGLVSFSGSTPCLS